MDLKEYVKSLIEVRDMALIQDAEQVRFTVKIPDHLNRRLDHISKQLGQYKSDIVENAISFLVSEVEDQLGLSLVDPEYHKIIFPGGTKKVTDDLGREWTIESKGQTKED